MSWGLKVRLEKERLDEAPPFPLPFWGQLLTKWSSLPQPWHLRVLPFLSFGFFFRPKPFPDEWDRCPLPFPLR